MSGKPSSNVSAVKPSTRIRQPSKRVLDIAAAEAESAKQLRREPQSKTKKGNLKAAVAKHPSGNKENAGEVRFVNRLISGVQAQASSQAAAPPRPRSALAHPIGTAPNSIVGTHSRPSQTKVTKPNPKPAGRSAVVPPVILPVARPVATPAARPTRTTPPNAPRSSATEIGRPPTRKKVLRIETDDEGRDDSGNEEPSGGDVAGDAASDAIDVEALEDEDEDIDEGHNGVPPYTQRQPVATEAIDWDDEGDANAEGSDNGDHTLDDDADDEADSESGGHERSGTKRKRSSGSNNGPHPKRAKPKAANYDHDTAIILVGAMAFFRTLCATREPWPSHRDRRSLADEAWTLSCEASPKLTPELRVEDTRDKIICGVLSGMRGKVKKAVANIFPQVYGFQDLGTRVVSNRNRCGRLVEDDAYTHEDPDKKQARWYCIILFRACREIFFTRSSDEGIQHYIYFKPIPPQLIALIYTAVRACLEEYRSGRRILQEFTEVSYKGYYEEHLTNLMAMDEVDPNFTKDLGTEVWNHCIDGHDIEDMSAKVSLTKDQIHQAVRDAAIRRARLQEERARESLEN